MLTERFTGRIGKFGKLVREDTSVANLIQIVNTQDGAVATGAQAIPYDDTIPQNTQGDEFMTLAITPKNTNNTLIIEVVVVLAHSTAGLTMSCALFQDSTAGALAAISNRNATTNADQPRILTFTHKMTAGTTSATTFKVRGGGTTGSTTTFNGSSGARRLGGVMASSITITEIAA